VSDKWKLNGIKHSVNNFLRLLRSLAELCREGLLYIHPIR